MSAAPATLALTGTGSANAASIALEQSAYTGTFTESDTCTGIASVASTSARGPSATYTVTGIAVGSCTATFAGAAGQHASVAISLTASAFGVLSHAREEQQ